MKLAALLSLLARSFETTHAKDSTAGYGGRIRARSLQMDFSMTTDARIEPAGFHDGPGSKSSKSPSRKVTEVCEKRLNVAFDEVKQFPEAFPDVTTRDNVTELCAFVAPEPNESEGKKSFNFGCPFFYLPEFDGTLNYFPKGVKEYRALTPPGGNPDAAQAFASVALYCSCYQGYDLGCSNELPTTPQESDEYCKFAGVWNGDISTTDFELSQTMLDCGCFWISEVTTEVGECPGVDLGYWEQNIDQTALGMLSLIPLQ